MTITSIKIPQSDEYGIIAIGRAIEQIPGIYLASVLPDKTDICFKIAYECASDLFALGQLQTLIKISKTL